MESRLSVALAGAALVVAIALAALGRPLVAIPLFVVAGLIVLGALGNKLPYVERLPIVGAPRVAFSCRREAVANKRLVVAHLYARVSAPVQTARVFLYVEPNNVDFWNANERGKRSGRGRMWEAGVWFDKADLWPGTPGPMSFAFPLQSEPYRVSLRLRIESEKLYGGYREETFELEVN